MMYVAVTNKNMSFGTFDAYVAFLISGPCRHNRNKKTASLKQVVGTTKINPGKYW